MLIINVQLIRRYLQFLHRRYFIRGHLDPLSFIDVKMLVAYVCNDSMSSPVRRYSNSSLALRICSVKVENTYFNVEHVHLFNKFLVNVSINGYLCFVKYNWKISEVLVHFIPSRDKWFPSCNVSFLDVTHTFFGNRFFML